MLVAICEWVVVFLSGERWCGVGGGGGFFFNDTATTEIYTLSLHDALPSLQIKLAVAQQIVKQRPEGFVGKAAIIQVFLFLVQEIGRAHV